MNRFGKIFSFVALPLIGASAILATANMSAAAGDKDGASAGGPLLIAQLPPKKEPTKYDLQYKLSRGEVLRYDVTHDVTISGTSDKTTQTVQAKTDSIKVWKVTDVLPSGDIEFMNVCERVRMVNHLPDNKSTDYDSTRDKIAPPGFEETAKAVGVPLSTVRITTRGEVLKRQVNVRNRGADEDGRVVLRLPDMPISIGETWDEPFEVKVNLQKGATKSIKTRWHHKLIDVKDDIATIDVTYQVLSPIDATVEYQLVQRMMSGQVLFDIKKGRIVSQQMGADKRILGFAGPTTSAQYVMKMEEKLLKDEPKTAAKMPAAKTPAKTKGKAPVASNRRPTNQPTKTANRPKALVPEKTYRR